MTAQLAGSSRRSLSVGPRETLEHVSAMLKDALACDDLAAVHRLLHEMQPIVENAIGRGRTPDVRMMRLRSMRLLKKAEAHSDSRR